MKTPLTIEQLAEIRFNTSAKLCPSHVSSWDEQSEEVKNANVEGMAAVIGAYHESLCDELPSVWAMRKVWMETPAGKSEFESVRNLMLVAFSKQTSVLVKNRDSEYQRLNGNIKAMDEIIGELQSKLAAIAKLPEKWREIAKKTCRERPGEYAQLKTVALELESSLGPTLVSEPAPTVAMTPIYTIVEALMANPEYAWGWHCNIAMACGVQCWCRSVLEPAH